jgi:hypothetical protein
MYQPHPPTGQAAKPLRPPAPAPVLTAVKLMYAGAAVNAVAVITSLSLISGIKAALRKANPGLAAAQVRDLNTLITLAIAAGLVVIALWLWMARTNGQGRTWARILSTVLFGLATLELPADIQLTHLGHLVLGGQVQPVIHYGFGVTVLAVIVPVLTWLAGLAAVWLLWRPASSAFFTPQGFVRVPPAAPRRSAQALGGGSAPAYHGRRTGRRGA